VLDVPSPASQGGGGIVNATEIKARRLAYPLTPTDLAKRLGVSANAVRAWERGDRVPVGPSKAALERLFAKRDGCFCVCHGGAPNSRQGVRAWSDAEIADLKQLVQEGKSPDEIVEILAATHGFRRSRVAITDRASRLGLSLYVHQFSATEAARELGVSRRRIDQLIGRGELRARRHIGLYRGRVSHWWRIEAADLEAFAAANRGQAV
jgi:DNA-binding XRE family transcriptional regulator